MYTFWDSRGPKTRNNKTYLDQGPEGNIGNFPPTSFSEIDGEYNLEQRNLIF